MYPHNSERTNLSAEVPPFVPKKEWVDEKWNYNQPSPLPRYVTTCYPFVQEQHDRRHLMSQQPQSMNPVDRWMGQSILPHPFLRTGLSSNDSSTSAHIIEINQSSYQGNIADSVNSSAVGSATGSYRASSHSHFQSRNEGRDKKNSKKVTKRNVGTQKEVNVPENVDDDDAPVMADKCQQTDFPISIACKSLTDRPSSLKKSNSSRRSRVVQVVDESPDSCSDNNEADVDSDSGYYSPKRRLAHKKNGGTSTSGLLESWQVYKEPSHTGNKQLQPVMLLPSSIPPALYYRMHSSSSPLPSGLPPHITPPPTGHVLGFPASGPSLIVNPPPPDHVINPISLSNRPPPGFPVPSGMVDPHSSYQLPHQLVWNGAQMMPPGYTHRITSSSQNHPPNRTNNDSRINSSSHHKKKGNHSGNVGSSRKSQDSFFGKKSIDQRKGNETRAQMTNSPVAASSSYNVVSSVQAVAAENPFYLENTQDFPGLGGASFVQSQNIGCKLSYSQVLLQGPPERRQVIAVQEAQKQPNNQKASKNAGESPGVEKAQKSRKRWKKAERASKAADEEYAGISEEQENIKKVLKKSATSRNKNKTPMLNLGEIFSKLEVNNSSASSQGGKRVVQIGGGVVRESSSSKPTPSSHRTKTIGTAPVNVLDSTAPAQKRGKERENPKPKKPSALKKVILKEREEKKEQRLQQLSTMTSPDHDVPPYPTDILKALPACASDSDDTPTKLNQLTTEDVTLTVPQIHSRRYREYCCQVLDKKIDDTCTIILQKLVQFQDRLYQKDPVKAKMRRRLVMGLREVTKHLKLKKLKCVIISPNLEKIQSKGGLDDTLQNILDLCQEQNVLYIFALGRKAMGRAVAKLVPVSIVGIFDYSGVEDHYKQLVELVKDAQNKYKDMITVYQQELIEANTPTVQPSGPTSSKRFAHMTHSRNPSAASCISFASFISEPISEMNEGSNWRVMMDAGEESTLSPPPEADGSTDEDPDNMTAVDDIEEVTTGKDSGNTSVGDKLANDCISSAIPEEEDEKETCNASPGSKELLNLAQKRLEQSFSSTGSTLVPTATKADNPPHQLSELPSPDENGDSESLIEAIENGDSSSAVQDRIHLWLKDTQQSVEDLNVDEEDDDDDDDDGDEDLAFSSPDTYNENSTGDGLSVEDKSES